MFGCQRLLESMGVVFGAPKHKEKTQKGLVDLGVLDENLHHDLTHNGYTPPDCYDEFVQHVILFRERGIQWARKRYVAAFGVLCEEQFQDAGQWTVTETIAACDKYLVKPGDVDSTLLVGSYKQCETGFSSTDMVGVQAGCRVKRFGAAAEAEGGMEAAVDLRKREVVDLPDDMKVATGPLQSTPVPPSAINPEELVIPPTVQKKMLELEAKIKEQARYLFQEDCDVSVNFDLEELGDAESLLNELKLLKDKAAVYRNSLPDPSVGRQGWQKKRKRPDMNPEEDLQSLLIVNGVVVLGLNGEYVNTDKVLKEIQERDKVKRDRCYRFIVTRLQNFSRAVRDGHDVTLGSCMLIRWGGKSSFAIVRVTRMYDDDGEMTYSQKLNRKSRKQHFRVELLTPALLGVVDGVQRYCSSGWQLGPVAGTLVLCLIDLVPLCKFGDAPAQAQLHDACLSVTKMLELQERGLKPVRCDRDGNLGAWVTDMDNGSEQICGYDRNRRCYRCKTCWYDHEKGVIVPCKTCGKRSFHQDCAIPKIKSADIGNWECSVCSGADSDLCKGCGEPYSLHEVEDPMSLENDELVCCIRCGDWWHQKCHVPHLYPMPIGHFICSSCVGTAPLTAEELVEECEPAVAFASRPKKRRIKRTRPPAAAPAEQAARMDRPRRVATQNATADAPSWGPPIGSTIAVYWSDEERDYEGTVKSYNPVTSEHHVVYHQDGDKQDEDLQTSQWKLVSQPTFKETAHLHSKRTERLVHATMPGQIEPPSSPLPGGDVPPNHISSDDDSLLRCPRGHELSYALAKYANGKGKCDRCSESVAVDDNIAFCVQMSKQDRELDCNYYLCENCLSGEEYFDDATGQQWCVICEQYKDPSELVYVAGSYHCSTPCVTGRRRR
jgi:hypothetical protein